MPPQEKRTRFRCLAHACSINLDALSMLNAAKDQMSRTATDGRPIGYRRIQGPNECRTGAKWKGRFNKRSGETREVIGTKELKKRACPEVLRTPSECSFFLRFRIPEKKEGRPGLKP
jgi:hypothetical protein